MAAITDAMPAQSMLQFVDGLVEHLWYFQSVLVNGAGSASCLAGSMQMTGSSPTAEAALRATSNEGAVPDHSATSDLAQYFHPEQLVMGSGRSRHDDQLHQQPEAVVQQMRRYMTGVHHLYQPDRADHGSSYGHGIVTFLHHFLADDRQHLQPLISVSSGAAGGRVVVDDQRLQRLRAVCTYEDLIRADASVSSSPPDRDDIDLENDDDDDQDELLAQAFDVYDKNRDGFISASELAYVLTQLGLLSCTTDDHDDVEGLCQTLIQRVDTDGNGLVDLHEFKTMMMCA